MESCQTARRRSPWDGRWLVVTTAGRGLVFVALLGAGCAGRESAKPEGGPLGRSPMEDRSRPVASPPVSSPETKSTSDWVVLGFEVAGNPDRLATVFEAVHGQETEFFLEVLRRSANEVRDVGSVLNGAARDVVLARGIAGAEIVVRELWGRACCLRRSFLAEGLDGMSLGLAMRGEEGVRETETFGRLEDLAVHTDSGVATSARAALRFFRDESPRH